jgi:hypothetical protein
LLRLWNQFKGEKENANSNIMTVQPEPAQPSFSSPLLSKLKLITQAFIEVE